MTKRNEQQRLNDSLMNNMSFYRVFGFSIAFLACLSLNTACSSDRSASRLFEDTTARAQADALVDNARAEVAALRRDLAASRIAISKREGEAEELSRRANALEADRAELRKMLEQAHSAVNALQIERDELKQTLVQTQTVGVAHPNSSAPTKFDETDLQADMKELNARMVLLTDELAQLKQRFSNTVRETSVRTSPKSSEQTTEASRERVVRDKPTPLRIVPSALFLAPAEPAPQAGHASDLSPQQGLIRVQPGDSLWKLAHEYATTIEELKRINGLTTDVVQAGQQLILPSSGGLDVRRCFFASPCNDPVN